MTMSHNRQMLVVHTLEHVNTFIWQQIAPSRLKYIIHMSIDCKDQL